MEVINMQCTNEVATVMVNDGRITRTCVRKVYTVPAIRTYKGEIPGVLGDSRLGVKRLPLKETPLIAHKPVLLIECSHK